MKRKNKSICALFFIVALLCISVGYAVLNSTLTINGKSSISKNTWSVHFENIKITDGSVTASVEPTILNNTTISNFELTLDKPGDFYEFTVDVKNTGTIDAMIDSVVKIPDLTDTQKKYLNYVISYQNEQEIIEKQIVKHDSFVRIKVRVEYKKDLVSSDLPTESETLTLGLNINYVQADDSGTEVFGRGITFVDGDINEIGTVVTIGTEKFYTIGTEAGNVKLLSMYNLEVGYEITNINFDTFEISMNALVNSTELQSSSARGAMVDGNGESYEDIIFPWVGITEFSSDEQHGANYSDYEGSMIEGYVNNYKTKLEETFDIEIVKARLILNEELTDSETFACSEDDYSCINSPYPWIYSTTYWTSSTSDTERIWSVFFNGNFSFDTYDELLSGVRPVIEVSLKELGITEFSPVADGDINEIGTVVTIGTEKFYTIGTEGNNVKLLSMYNLYVGSECFGNFNSCKAYGDEATGMQKSTMAAMNYNGVVAFSTGGTYLNYEGSDVQKYVFNYENKLKKMFGLEVDDSRVLTYGELINELGCVASEYSCASSNYSWIYSTSYWTSSVDNDEGTLWTVGKNGLLLTYGYDDFYFGVRPVIVISRDEIVINNDEKKIIEFTIDDSTYQAEEGMTWEKWTNSDYNTCGLVISGTELMISAGNGGRLYNDLGNNVSISDIILENGRYGVAWMSDKG